MIDPSLPEDAAASSGTVTGRDEESRRGAAASEGAEEEPEPLTPVDSLKVVVTCVVAWAVPGLGHVASGRVGRGALFALVVLSLFVGGIALDGKVYRPEEGMPLSYVAAVGSAGVGLPYVIAHGMEVGSGDMTSPTYEYGNTFTLVAGLLNLLVVLDAYDVAAGTR